MPYIISRVAFAAPLAVLLLQGLAWRGLGQGDLQNSIAVNDPSHKVSSGQENVKGGVTGFLSSNAAAADGDHAVSQSNLASSDQQGTLTNQTLADATPAPTYTPSPYLVVNAMQWLMERRRTPPPPPSGLAIIQSNVSEGTANAANEASLTAGGKADVMQLNSAGPGSAAQQDNQLTADSIKNDPTVALQMNMSSGGDNSMANSIPGAQGGVLQMNLEGRDGKTMTLQLQAPLSNNGQKPDAVYVIPRSRRLLLT